MQEQIKEFAKNFLKETENQSILIVHHFDTDGVTSAAIFARMLKKVDKKFSFKIVKSLDKETIESLPANQVIVFLDLASGSLEEINKLKNQVYIIDHHEITEIKLEENIRIINPHLFLKGEEMSSSCLAYLITREITKADSDAANLAIIGMVGDMMEKKVGPLANSILKDAEVTLKRGLLLYPSTRPLNKTLEYSANPYIQGVTGNREGVTNLLREASIGFSNTGYKSLIELDEEEMSRLVTAIALRINDPERMPEFIGNLYLVRFFNKLEDARELSALINACSRMNEPNIALLLCLGNQTARKNAETVYIKYKQSIIDALNHINSNPKIAGNQYVIMNAKDKIQDTIIGTIASIISMSALYKEGTIVITMAYNQDKIKVSSRICGKERVESCARNLRDFMNEITAMLGGESGGHQFAAGCVISKDKEEAFIELVKKKLDIEIVKVENVTG